MAMNGRQVPTVRIAYKEPKVMAEIGCNHMGDFEIAKELLTLAKQSGADFGKFQKRNPKELLTAEQFAAPHPNPRNAYGDTYGAHREYLELTVDQHRDLKKVRRRTKMAGHALRTRAHRHTHGKTRKGGPKRGRETKAFSHQCSAEANSPRVARR
jgi:hypothetical protein